MVIVLNYPVACMMNLRDKNHLIVVTLFILLFYSIILTIPINVICYYILVDLSYIMYNDLWIQNKSNQIILLKANSHVQNTGS
jgi:hypothetical protein